MSLSSLLVPALGYLGAALLAFCGVPLLFRTRGGDRLFLASWLLGELTMLVYVLEIDGPAPLVTNYALSAALVFLIVVRRRS